MEILKHCLLSHWPVPLHRDFLDFVGLSAATERSSSCLYVDLASGNRTQTKPSSSWKCVKMNNSYLFSAKLSSR